MLDAIETRIPAINVQSLVWDGDVLVDWAAGGQRLHLSGEVVPSQVSYAYPFDAATSLPGSDYAAIYTRLGTKGLILRAGKIIREINRSHYFADTYEYPLALFRLGSGREVIAHCPDEYCRLEIEDLQSGEVLTSSPGRKGDDIFHSRLAVSADGKHLLTAGWLWHPVDAVKVYDVEAALEDPRHLDSGGIGIDAWADEGSAAFLPGGRLAVGLNGVEDESGAEVTGDTPVELRLFELQGPRLLSTVRMADRLGTLMPLGTDHLLALYDHPRVIELSTGAEVASWPHVKTGTQTSSILRGAAAVVPLAIDTMRGRVAVADHAGITVLQFAV